MPSEETSGFQIVFLGDGDLVEFLVVGVNKGDVFQAFVLLVEAIADDLDLGLVGDSFEIGMEDRTPL